MTLSIPDAHASHKALLEETCVGNQSLAQWVLEFRTFVQQASEQADVGHQLDHITRVAHLAYVIGINENADLAVVVPAAWLHDAVFVDKRSADRKQASRYCAEAALAYLHKLGYPQQYEQAIAHAIEAHSYSAGILAQTLEAKVVQDADRLDAIGATGIARTLMLGGQWHSQLYHAADPSAQQRTLDDRTYVLDHFYQKLLGLFETLQTPTGRSIGASRTQYMRDFIEQLLAEKNGGC
tara:strand:- start:881 stop:1594 length:714 start_codon:yes stop_codon:yes gene_type:complete